MTPAPLLGDAHPAQGLFQHRYQLKALLKAAPGRETWLGEDQRTRQSVVVKLTSVLRLPPAGRWRLNREAEILRQLEHPCLIPLLDAGFAGQWFFVVLPYRDAPTLRQRLQAGPLDLATAVSVAIDILRGLEAAHQHGVLHRNLNCPNVLIGSPAQVMDFSPLGVAELPDEGVLPIHLAPEQAGLLHGDIDARSDLYAVGVLLYEALTGRPPFVARTLTELLQAQLTQALLPMRSLVASLPRALDDLVTRLLARDPRARYQSAAGVLWDLGALRRALADGTPDPDLAIGLFDRRHTLAEPAFVGRHAELAALRERLAQVRDGLGGVLAIEAVSGMGKSRLLQEVGLLALQQGMLVLRYTARPQSLEHPFEGFTGLVGELLQRLTRPEIEARLGALQAQQTSALRSLVPAMRELLPPDHESADPAVSETYVLDVLAAWLMRLGQSDRPTVVLLDDAQWADGLTRRVLVRFHQLAGYHSHVLVLAGCRTGEGPAGLPGVTRLALAPFGPDDTRQLLESMAGPLPAEARDLIDRVSEGSPLMAADALRALVGAGGLRHETGGWLFDAVRSSESQSTPRAVAALERRLEHVSGQVRRVLQIAALLGRQCDMELLAAVTDAAPPVLLAVVEEARRAHLIWPAADGTGLSFAHDRLREALAAEISPAEAGALHRSAATWLQQHHPEQIFELAFHLEHTDAASEALPWALAAAGEAARRHALDVAARYYALAARVIEQADSGSQQAMALAYAQVLMRLGRFAEADDWLRKAQARSHGPLESARLEGWRARLALDWRDPVGAQVFAIAGLQTLGEVLPGVTTETTVGCDSPDAMGVVIELCTSLAEASGRLGDMGTARQVAAHAEARARGRDVSAALMVLYARQAVWLTHDGDLVGAMACGERARLMAQALEDPVNLARTLVCLVQAYLLDGRLEDAVRFATQARAILLNAGDPRETTMAGAILAEALEARGRRREAASLASEIVRRAADSGDSLGHALALAAWSRASGGAVPQEVLQPWLEPDPPWPADVEARAALTQAVAIWHLGRGNAEAAVAVLQGAEGVFWPQGLRAANATWLAAACRRVWENLPMLAVAARSRWLGRAQGSAGQALALGRKLRRWHAAGCREAALCAAARGQLEEARALFGEGLAAVDLQPYEGGLLHLARHRVGAAVEWRDSAQDEAAGWQELTRLEVGNIPELGVNTAIPSSPVTVSLVDRFSNVVDVGRRLVGAMSVQSLLRTLSEATRTLLRGEQVHLYDVTAQMFLDADPPQLAMLLRDQVLDSGQAVAVDVALAAVSEAVWLAPERCGLGAPVRVGGDVRYVFVSTQRQTEGVFGTDELRLADYLGTVSGAVLENLANVEARLESEVRFRILYERADVGIALIHPDGRLMDGNPFLSRATGYGPDELPGLVFETLIGPLYREQALRQLRPLLQGDINHCRLELACRRKTGELLWMEAAASLVRASDGQPRFVIAALSDVSHRRLEQVVGFQETERRVLSSELHDTIAQPLVALYYGLQNIEVAVAEGGDTLDRVRRLEDQTERLLGELRALISNISVPESDDFEALGALEQYAHEFRADSGLEVRLWTQGLPRVSGVAGLFLYRIVQEALRNAARHGEASGVSIRIEVRGRRVRGTVVDNGQGFVPGPVEGRHFGLRGMRERAELLGGWCHVRSRPGRGTRVIFELPLAQSLALRP